MLSQRRNFYNKRNGPTSRKHSLCVSSVLTVVLLLYCSLWQLHVARSFFLSTYTVKKVNDFPVPSRDVTNLFYSAYLRLCDICYSLSRESGEEKPGAPT